MTAEHAHPTLFFDANVLFSAARNPEGRSAALVALARRGRCALITSHYATEEARRNLELKHPERAAQLDALLRAMTIVPEANEPVVQQLSTQHHLPMADAPILAAAVQAGADALVTGDRADFGHLMDHSTPSLPFQIVSVASAFRWLVADRSAR